MLSLLWEINVGCRRITQKSVLSAQEAIKRNQRQSCKEAIMHADADAAAFILYNTAVKGFSLNTGSSRLEMRLRYLQRRLMHNVPQPHCRII